MYLKKKVLEVQELLLTIRWACETGIIPLFIWFVNIIIYVLASSSLRADSRLVLEYCAVA